MAKRLAILVLGALFVGSDARAQSAGEALKTIIRSDSSGVSKNLSSALYGLLLAETTTFPIGSSAGGFAWTFDSDLRVPSRRSSSFGPMFAERPFTTGKGRLNVGAVFQRTTFTSVGGQPLTDLKSSVVYEEPRQEYTYTSSIQVEMARTIVSATYGIHDRVDIGVIAPMGSATVSGFSSYYEIYEGVESTNRTNGSGSSFGIGDVVIRTKAALMATHRLDAAATLDVRLPTGDPEQLMGTGYTQAKLMFIGGSTWGSMTPHVNLGYTLGGSGMTFGGDNRYPGSSGDPQLIGQEASEEFNYTVGVDVAATPRITIAGDVIGRVVQRSVNITAEDHRGSAREIKLVATPGAVNMLLGAVGAKVNVGGSWLMTGTILFPLNDNGITPGVTPVFGFERAF